VKAIVPVNVTALRVTRNDATNVTSKFRGGTVAFDALPHGPGAVASTGDTIAVPIDGTRSPAAPLGLGVHLHWELPDFFRRGGQDTPERPIRFPQVPNRWLVTRTCSAGTAPAGSAPVSHRSWIVESDFVARDIPLDSYGQGRTSIAIPPLDGLDPPSMLMGRVVDADSWDPASDDPASYLPHYRGPDGAARYLTAMGFVGPSFCGYYPDCRSVFGFWDTLRDLPEYPKLAQSAAVDLTFTYTVIGWIAGPAADPLEPLATLVRGAYDHYVDQCAAEKVKLARTPLDFFHQATADKYGWTFTDQAFSVTTDAASGKISSISVPDSTLCHGVLQDVVWSGTGPFLAPAGGQPSLTAQVQLAVGNTTAEAVAALVKDRLPAPPAGAGVLDNYELLLEALQLGALRDLEAGTQTLARLAEQRHARSFAMRDGGHLWTVESAARQAPGRRPVEATLPLDLAEQLHLLNRAQQAYDDGRALIAAAREQLFMDWTIFVRQWVAEQSGASAQYVVSTGALSDFIETSAGGELNAVQALTTSVGLIDYHDDATISTASPAGTLAADLIAAFKVVQAGLPSDGGWHLVLGPAPRYAMPTDPVLVMQGDRIEPARRNGPSFAIAVRTDTELITQLEVTDQPAQPGQPAPQGQHSAVLTPADATAPAAPATTPAAVGPAVISALLGEAALLSPQSAGLLASALAARGFTASLDDLTAATQACQGGGSPLGGGAISGGLFGASHAVPAPPDPPGQLPPGQSPFLGPQPAQQVATPISLRVVFANPRSSALAPDAVGWSAQAGHPELDPSRVDPFLPVWMTWDVTLWPLARPGGDDYPQTVVADAFVLDDNGVDLTYRLTNGAPAMPLTKNPVRSRGAVVLSTKALASLTDQIDRFRTDFASDPADDELRAARDAYGKLPVLAQAIGTFNQRQTLRQPIPMIEVMDLVADFDPITTDVASAAVADTRDTWYATAFNSLAPMPAGDVYYSPLRGGFLDVNAVKIVDVFGQVMDIQTATRTSRNALVVTPSLALRPQADDTSGTASVYLPPRPLAATRVDARWLSATHNDHVRGVTGDFVEMNAHPATSPVCGWIVPNHLDVTLAFYDAGGSPIGSFGIEHDQVTYRTRPGNPDVADPQLPADIGQPGQPARVNSHVARLMWFVAGQSTDFLAKLMAAISASDGFIAPAASAQDPSLAVLIGRPLAITRACLAMTTAGGVLPASQLNSGPSAALKTTVDAGRTSYAERQRHTSAGLAEVAFPARLGNLIDIDDGLVAFLPEATDGSYSIAYLPAAPAESAHLRKPGPATTELRLSSGPQVFTLIVDPRAPVHVSTGVLPTAELVIPPDQYSDAMRSLAVTFTMHPVLRPAGGLVIAVPEVSGFDWVWIATGADPVRLAGQADPGRPVYGYTPQTLIEGWLKLARQSSPEQGE
jgi:hypothetical protein